MTKVHPNGIAPESPRPVISCSDACQSQAAAAAAAAAGTATILTVWRKSLLFNCNGFTVFDAKGNIVFRVDNYSSGPAGEVVLMDAGGRPVVTVRRKKLSLADHWLIYDGEQVANPRLSARKKMNPLHSKTLAHISPCRSAASGGCFDVEGSYSHRNCVVYDELHRPVAELRRKEPVGGVAFGADVFRLMVYPGLDAAIAMAVIVVLEQMFGVKPPRGLCR